jgi:serine/threonine protein kinase
VPKKGEILRTTFENFEILDQIKTGGAGEVYRAKNTAGELVAIKVLRSDPDSRKRKRLKKKSGSAVKTCIRTSFTFWGTEYI